VTVDAEIDNWALSAIGETVAAFAARQLGVAVRGADDPVEIQVARRFVHTAMTPRRIAASGEERGVFTAGPGQHLHIGALAPAINEILSRGAPGAVGGHKIHFCSPKCREVPMVTSLHHACWRAKEEHFMFCRIRRFGASVLRWVRLRPPPGHMDMLRGVVGRHEVDRMAREVEARNRQARGGANAHDAHE
jgi:hypothetical protein